MPRRRNITGPVTDVVDDEDRPVHKPRILEDSMFLRGEFTDESLEDVYDEDPDYLRRLLKDDELHPRDRSEISQLIGEEED